MKNEERIKATILSLFFIAVGSGIVAIIWMIASLFVIVLGE